MKKKDIYLKALFSFVNQGFNSKLEVYYSSIKTAHLACV